MRCRRSVFALLALGIVLIAGADIALANPQGIPDGWHKVYQFNMIGYPAGQEYTGGCGQGNRVFVNRDAHNARMLVTDGASWDITDCNATADNWAEMTTNDTGSYAVFVRILGQPGGSLSICADTYEDYIAGETLCLLGTIDLTRGPGHSRFELAPSSMFDASLEDIVWSIETNTGFRNAQFRVYRLP
jgi:hypothetical protein